VRQPRKRWVSHSWVAGCTAIAAVVTSGVSHRFSSVTKSRDRHKACGSCWSCAIAAKAVGQSQLSRLIYRYRCRRDLRRLPQVLQRDENPVTGIKPVGAAGAVRQPRKRWVRHSGVAGCTAIAAAVTSGVSHRLCRVAKSRDWHEPCGRRRRCATAAKAVGQSLSSGRMYRYRCRRDLRRLPQVVQGGENPVTGTRPVGAAGAVRQPRKRWVSHSGVAGCAGIAAVVTSGVSHRFAARRKSCDRHKPVGAAGAVRQPRKRWVIHS
jgi:hypothetical protein